MLRGGSSRLGSRMKKARSRHWHALGSRWLSAALLAPGAATCAEALQTPAEAQFGVERIELPGHERLGLVGASYLLQPLPGLHVGPALYGAASGRRGGLFVIGAEAAWRLRLGGPLQLQAGF